MQLKTFFLSIVMTALWLSSNAQDKIYKRNGDIIDAKIKSVGTKTVTYQRTDNLTGPEYTILKIDVEKIVYQNGDKDEFDTPPRRHHPDHKNTDIADEPGAKNKISYPPNILALAPIQVTENGLGFSLSYERRLDKNGLISFYLPVIATYNLNSSTYYNQSTGATVNGNPDVMFYAMPGIKLYPTGCDGYVKYSVGPSLVIASGQKSSFVTDPVTYNASYQTQVHTELGMVINNTLNINPNPHIYLGLELGLGITYLNRVGGLNQDANGIVQAGFKIGYRF